MLGILGEHDLLLGRRVAGVAMRPLELTEALTGALGFGRQQALVALLDVDRHGDFPVGLVNFGQTRPPLTWANPSMSLGRSIRSAFLMTATLVASTIVAQAQRAEFGPDCSPRCMVGRTIVDPSRCRPDQMRSAEQDCRAFLQETQRAQKQKEQEMQVYRAREQAVEQQRLDRESKLALPATPWFDPPLAPPLTRDDQARISNTLLGLLKQYDAVSKDGSLTSLQRQTTLEDMVSKLTQAGVPNNSHVIWSCHLKDVVQARTEFGSPHQMDPERHTHYAAICTYGGFDFTLYLAESDPVLAQSKPGTDLTFDGYSAASDQTPCALEIVGLLQSLDRGAAPRMGHGCLPGMPTKFLVRPGGITF
jgi:hypothetical protein